MLKATMESPQGSGNHTLLRDFMVLEEGETLSSVRKPEKRKEALELLDRIKVEFEANCTQYVPDPLGATWRVIPQPNGTYKKERLDTGTPGKRSARFNAMTNRLFQLLLDEFLPTRPPEEREMAEDIRRLLRHEGSVNVDTCYNSTFAVWILRKALKHYQLPIIHARLWKPIALQYCALVMAA